MRSRLLIAIVATTLISGAIGTVVAVAPEPGAIQNTWARTDKPVADGQVNRTWMWGPEANTNSLTEPYVESPGGQRTVQYFDKSRMEITYPAGDQSDPWYVTNGLLVVELISGKMQVGDATFEDRAPAAINAAGDQNDPNGITYQTLGGLLNAAPFGEGTTITAIVDHNGTVGTNGDLAKYGVTAGPLVAETNHRVASVFWDFMNSTGLVYEDSSYLSAPLFQNPYFATGFPVTEAYWATISVAGVSQNVLIQTFERRVLTYTPGNSAGWQVEAGNVGQHYYQWRYQGKQPQPPPSEPPPVTDNVLYQSNLSDWPAVDGILGDRGYPGTASYHIENEPGSLLTVFDDQQFSDAMVELDVRRVSGVGDGVGCLLTRAAPDREVSFILDHGYILCAGFVDQQTRGVFAAYWWFDIYDELQSEDLGDWQIPPRDQSSWVSLGMRMNGAEFEFYLDGSLLGTASSTGSVQGQVALMSMSLDSFTSHTEFRNLRVTSISSTPPPSPTATPTSPPAPTATPTLGVGCHPSYPDHCIAPPPPQLHCSDLPSDWKPIRVLHNVPNPDPHRFDGNNDGWGCEDG